LFKAMICLAKPLSVNFFFGFGMYSSALLA